MFKRNILLLSIILTSFFLLECTFTTTIKKNPAFTIRSDSIARDLKSIILTEEINVNGIESKTNGKSKSELTIELINPKLLPIDTSNLYETGEQVATLVKHLLKDPGQYDYFKVLFIQRKTNEGITKSNYTEQTYKSNDLKNYIRMVTLGDQFDPSTSRAIGKSVFSRDDSEIITAFKYYNVAPYSPVAFKMFKETDSVNLLLMSKNQGQTEPGNNFFLMNLKVSDFYKIKELGSGYYKIEYTLNDTVVGTKSFRLL